MNIWNVEEEGYNEPLKHHYITRLSFVDKKTGNAININENLKNRLRSSFDIEGFKTSRSYVANLTVFIKFLESTNQFNQILVREENNDLAFMLAKKSPYYMTFSQNFSASGKIGLSYEFGLRNYLSLFEILSFKAEKHIDEGNSVDFNLSLPFISQDRSADISAGFVTNMLFPEFKVEKLSTQLKINNNKHNNFFSIGMESNRPVFEPLKFKGQQYEPFLNTENNINFTFGKNYKNKTRFFHAISNYMEAKLFVYSFNRGDVQLNWKNNSRFYLHELLPFKFLRNNIKYYTMEVENSTNILMNNAINRKSDISMIKKSYFNRNRGYYNLHSNLPFKNANEHIHNQISVTHSAKLNLKHFPLIQNENCFPFFHFTSYFNSYNWFRMNTIDSCIGTGLVYKMDERISIELLYNFIHLNSRKSPFTKTENFQIRISFDD